MYINSSEFTSLNKELRIYNLYPYILEMVDIYFITSDTVLYNDLLSINGDGLPKLDLIIDGNKYPLLRGLPGESPQNPIRYKKSVAQSKVSFTEPNTLDNTKIAGFVGSSEINDWVVGANINDVDDFITITINVNSMPTKAATICGYGRSENLKTENNTVGAYGYGNSFNLGEKNISYGGYENDFIFNTGAIIVEPSDKKTRNYLYSAELVSDLSLTEFGWGESSWGGLIEGSSSGYGGIIN